MATGPPDRSPISSAESDQDVPHLDDTRLTALLERLTLEEKVRLVTGRDFWTTWPMAHIALRRILVSDGPSGVRGEVWDERSPSLNLPSATALSSSWDVDIAARYGAVAAVEARRKGVDVVLGPTINLHRSPLGGRHFEAFSEDPLLTGELAAAYVRGVQDHGVGATPKHYVANDSETERFTVDVIVEDRALRELYLSPFEKAVTQGRAWLVMSAYNAINGSLATENELLESPLNAEWGFDGVVISDWTAVRSLRSAEHAQDLVMPGPGGPWGDALVDAVRAGSIAESTVDRKVRRLLLLAARVGALEGFEPPPTADGEDGRAFAREAAVEGTVLLRNDGALPWSPGRRDRIAVIGHNATQARTQGGGSATVVPDRVIAPLDGIRDAFPDAEVTYALGAVVQEGISEFAPASMTNPTTGGPGARVRFLDADGGELFAEDRFSGALVYLGGDAPVAGAATVEFATRWTPDRSGPVRIGFASVGRGRVHLDGQLVVEETVHPVGDDLGAAFLSPPTVAATAEVSAGVPVEVRVELEPLRSVEGLGNAMSITVGTEADDVDPDELIGQAAAAAAGADVAVVVVGTNAKVESEGYDRTSLRLPGRQDELVSAVAAANPHTVVVVNAGAPVLLPWREDVAAVLLTYFGGQEYGHALADVLTGAREPGGRLPTTWPDAEADVPVIDVTPVEGTLRYDEGIHVGYRAWLRSGREPAYPFGHGLGYTSWRIHSVQVEDFDEGASATVVVEVANEGARAGKQVIQVYAERPDSGVDRPSRWLVGFAVIRAAAGMTATARISVPRRALAYWDREWQYELGAYTLRVGTSVVDLPHAVDVHL